MVTGDAFWVKIESHTEGKKIWLANHSDYIAEMAMVR